MSHTDITEDTDEPNSALLLEIKRTLIIRISRIMSLGSSARKKNQQINLGWINIILRNLN